MIFKEAYDKYKLHFEKLLDKCLNKYCAEDNVIFESIKYSILDAGKRIRPVLCYATNEMLGGANELVDHFALAIEMIHTYSLVHDDLPCMDNDDYRRGKLSTHKKFGENIGVLTGDALLNLAFETVLSKSQFTPDDALALSLLSKYSGAKGMIKGQVLDLINENNDNAGETELLEIYHNKTAKLISAPILLASILNGKKYFNQLSEFGYYLGVLFQLVDDVMDVESDFSLMGKSPNKDFEEGKLTSIKIYGLDKAKEMCNHYYDKCVSILKEIPKSDFLMELTRYSLNRRK